MARWRGLSLQFQQGLEAVSVLRLVDHLMAAKALRSSVGRRVACRCGRSRGGTSSEATATLRPWHRQHIRVPHEEQLSMGSASEQSGSLHTRTPQPSHSEPPTSSQQSAHQQRSQFAHPM